MVAVCLRPPPGESSSSRRIPSLPAIREARCLLHSSFCAAPCPLIGLFLSCCQRACVHWHQTEKEDTICLPSRRSAREPCTIGLASIQSCSECDTTRACIERESRYIEPKPKFATDCKSFKLMLLNCFLYSTTWPYNDLGTRSFVLHTELSVRTANPLFALCHPMPSFRRAILFTSITASKFYFVHHPWPP